MVFAAAIRDIFNSGLSRNENWFLENDKGRQMDKNICAKVGIKHKNVYDVQ